MGAHAYQVTNLLSSLSATAFTWSTGATTDRSLLIDGRMDRRMNIGASVASGVNVIIDLGTPRQLIGVAVLNSNDAIQKSDAALKVEASSSPTFGADVNIAKAASTLYSNTIDTHDPRAKDHVLQWNANFNKQYWRLTWTWTGSVTNFSIGELFAYASITQLSRRSIYGSGETGDAKVALTEMQYGNQRGTYLAGPIRQVDLSFSDLNATARLEQQAMHSLSRYGALPLLWVQSYEAVATAAASSEQDCIFGRLQRPAYKFTEPDFQLYTPDSFMLRSEGREAGA